MVHSARYVYVICIWMTKKFRGMPAARREDRAENSKSIRGWKSVRNAIAPNTGYKIEVMIGLEMLQPLDLNDQKLFLIAKLLIFFIIVECPEEGQQLVLVPP